MGTREIAPFGVRMPPELKARLEAAAKVNGRSLNAELTARLEKSLESPQSSLAVEDTRAEYRVLNEHERSMLALYRRWPPDKQLSFLVLFR